MGQSVINYFCGVLADKGLTDSKQLQLFYIWKLFATGDGLGQGCIFGEQVEGESRDRCVHAHVSRAGLGNRATALCSCQGPGDLDPCAQGMHDGSTL